jgi:DNA-binding response OmpR family regulator
VAENVTLKDGDFSFCGAKVSPRRMMIFFANGGRNRLGGKELGLMNFFESRAGQIVPRREVINAVWGPSGNSRSRSLDQYIVRIRKLFRHNGQREIEWLETLHGLGFRYSPTLPTASADEEPDIHGRKWRGRFCTVLSKNTAEEIHEELLSF